LPPAVTPSPVQRAVAQHRQFAGAAYTIGPEDVLRITVYEHPDLSQEVVVAPDGSFSYPLIGTVQAAGLTVRQLEAQMVRRLADGYLVAPQLTITVTQSRSRQVHVLGAVKAPGNYVLQQNTTLVELLSKAGGPTPDAGWYVTIVRSSAAGGEGAAASGEGPEVLRVDLEQLLAGKMGHIKVYSGDTVYVHESAFFFVSGQVRNPGRYRLTRGMTILKAITLAGGPTEFAAKKRVRVRRTVQGQLREFSAAMSDLVEPEDVIIVPESLF
jgi:polysaccharide export outer membrane protein